MKECINATNCLESHLTTNLPVKELIEYINKDLEQKHQPLNEIVLDCGQKLICKSTLVKSTKDPISDEFKRAEALSSDLEESLTLVNGGCFCKPSLDAGLFICNYCYYSSLWFGEGKKNCHSLFIHVPPHDVIPVSLQIQFVKSLIRAVEYVFSEHADL